MGDLIKFTFDEVIPLLDDIEQHGDYIKALCPAHNDNKRSLTMKRGDNNEAVCHCFAGCTSSDIFKALYSRSGSSPRFLEEKPIKKSKKEYGKEIARYNYSDENDITIKVKVRCENKAFYWITKKKGSPLPLFNLKEVIEKDPIFLVEGEKDVLTIKSFGYGATNDRSGEGLSIANAKKYLSGKNIIVLPDNDKAGQKYANDSADLLVGIANSIKIVDLSTLWSDIPEKADVTDYIEHGGNIEQIIEQASKTEEHKKAIRSTNPHAAVWNEIEGYTLNSKGQICYIKNENELTPLCHGSIIITEVIYNNDGLEDNILFKCEGVTESGVKLPDVTIPVDEFDSLKWITKKWGCAIVPFGSQSTTQKLLCGIKLTGGKAAATFQKCHTGYVNDSNGKPIAYLHAGGSIGNQDLICELDFRLHQYKLLGASASAEERKEAFSSSLSILHAHRESITYPLLSFAYMPPIAQINKAINGECGFCLYLRGKTQNGKSTLAALTMSHFGQFSSTTPPTSFESTFANNEKMSFLLKDSILWVDDFHPKGNKQSRDNQNEQFNRIARASGDRAFRGRLNSNSEFMKAQNVPRCLYLVTGEDDPQLSQSGLARIFTIDVKDFRKEDHDISGLRRAARNGLLSRAMSDYISYIIGNYEEVTSRFERLYEKVIAGTQKNIGENRLSIQAALLITSFDMWLFYALQFELLDKTTAEALSLKNRSIIMGLANKISNEIKESDPAEKFVSTLSAMISNREVELRDIHFGDKDNELFGVTTNRIGWFDEVYYYLDKEKTYAAVKQKLDSVDDSIGVTMNGLFRQMIDSGMIDGDKNSYNKVKNINGKNKRVIFIKRSILDPE